MLQINKFILIFFLQILGPNPFAELEKQVNVNGVSFKYFDIANLGERYGNLKNIFFYYTVQAILEQV